MPERLAKKVLLIGWDAADWNIIRPLMAEGWMPTLKRFIAEGVHGNLSTLEPILSPMLWTSIATGKRPEKHGILGFVEPDSEGNGLRPVTSTSRRCKAIWNILTQRGLSSNVVGWYASHPAEPIRGASVSNHFNAATMAHGQPWPLRPFTVHPARLEGALAEARVHPGDLDQSHLQPLVPRLAEIDQKKERNLAVIARLLAECASNHAAITWLMEHEPADFTAVYYDAIDHFCHGFMEFHPPRQPRVSERSFEMYKDVVTGCYKYHDMMLHRLLKLAGDDTTVLLISDHGFHSGNYRPVTNPKDPTGPTLWHRPYGVFCARGPNLKRGETIFGAGVLDITPTILTLLGLPVGADMDGRVLRQIFERPVEPDRVMSWENMEGECGRHPAGFAESPEESAAAIQQLVDLGYIDPPDEKQKSGAAWAVQQSRFHLACAMIDSGNVAEAAALLEELHREKPEDARITAYLLRCRYRLGELDACRELAAPMMAQYRDTPLGHLLSGSAALAEGRYAEAITHFQAGEKIQGQLPDVHYLLGQSYLKIERWADAERSFRRAIEIDGDSARAYDGLAAALLRQDRNEDAAEAALAAVGLQHHLPGAHFHLGVALARLSRFAEAATAFEQCLAIRSESHDSHRWLVSIYRDGLNDSERAKHHERRAREIADEATIKKSKARSETEMGPPARA